MPDNDLTHYLYVSRSIRPARHKSDFAILAACEKNNAIQGITGLLLRGKHLFFQVLEGTEPAVRTLFETISKDPRHGQVRHWIIPDVQTRQFEDWDMAFALLRKSAETRLYDAFCDDSIGPEYKISAMKEQFAARALEDAAESDAQSFK